MAESRQQMTVDLASSRRTIDTAIRIGLIALLVYWCLHIFRPFLVPVLWAMIIAVAVQPLYRKFEALLGGNKKLALTLFTAFAFALLILPTVMLVRSVVDTIQHVYAGLDAGTLRVPPPSDSVASWPVIGEQLHAVWTEASNNLTATVKQYESHLKEVGKWVLSAAAGAGAGVLQFFISILIAAAFLANQDGAYKFSRSLAVRLAGEEGGDIADLTGATLRSVAQGVLGVAVIQAILAGLGMLLMGVPGAGLWALAVLVLAVLQLPALLVLGPVIIYVFSVSATLPAVLFTIWSLLVGVSDTFLKPMLLGRGVNIPMLVILVGSIGGMMTSGIIGLFVGAVVLALGYKLFLAWLAQDFEAPEEKLAVKESVTNS